MPLRLPFWLTTHRFAAEPAPTHPSRAGAGVAPSYPHRIVIAARRPCSMGGGTRL